MFAVTQVLPASILRRAAADWVSEPGWVEQIPGARGQPALFGNAASFEGVISADGNFVAYVSHATNITPDNPPASGTYGHIYVNNRLTGQVFRITPNDAYTPSACVPDCWKGIRAPSISADGRTVAYESDRPLLASVPDNNRVRVYVQSLNADGSRAGAPVLAVDSDITTREPAVSGNGRYVAFTTSAAFPGYDDAARVGSLLRPAQLASDATHGVFANDDVYLRDLQNMAAVPRLVSQRTGMVGVTGNGQSGEPSVNFDGSVVAFTSRSTDLATGVEDTNGAVPSVFRRQVDLVTADPVTSGGTTTMVATAEDGRAVHEPAVSEDGNRVAYVIGEPVLSISPDVSQMDMGSVNSGFTTQQDLTIANTGSGDMPWTVTFSGANPAEFTFVPFPNPCRAVLYARESCPGRVVFQPGSPGTRTATMHIQTGYPSPVGTEKTIALTGVGPSPGSTTTSTTLPDTTSSTTTTTTIVVVAPPEANGADDVYMKDLVTNGVIAVTPRNPALCGGCGARDARNPAISSDGSTVGFESASADLHAGDTNGNDDVFVRVVSDPVGPIERASLTLQQLELEAGAESRNASLSADGTYVTFDSDAEFPGPTFFDLIPTPSWPAVKEPPSPARQASKAEPPKPSTVPGSTRDVFERRRDPIPFLDPNTLEVSGVEVGADSAPQTVTLRNTGPGPVRVTGSPVVTGGPWTIVPGPGTTCVPGVTLHRGQTCTVQVVFHPTSTGPDSSTLTVPVSAAPNSLPGSPAPPRTASLTGAGVAPTFTHTPQVDFGAVPPGTPSGLQPVTITNTGTAPHVVGPLSITGPDASDFTIDPSTTCNDVPIPPGDSCTVFIRFTPSGPGPRTATLQGTFSTASTPFSIPLTGSGQTVGIQVDPTSVAFGNATVGSTPAVERTVTVSNTGNANLTIVAVSLPEGSPHFSIVEDLCAGRTLEPEQSCTIRLAFQPTAAGTQQGSLSIARKALGSPTLVPLSGTGVAPTTTSSTSTSSSTTSTSSTSSSTSTTSTSSTTSTTSTTSSTTTSTTSTTTSTVPATTTTVPTTTTTTPEPPPTTTTTPTTQPRTVTGTTAPPTTAPPVTTTTVPPTVPPTVPVFMPTIRMAIPLGPPGQPTAVEGSGFRPNSTVQLRWLTAGGPSEVFATVRTDGSGAFAATQILIMRGEATGPRTIEASAGPDQVATASYLVVPSPAQPLGNQHLFGDRAQLVARR